jgi:hypothetical protein
MLRAPTRSCKQSTDVCVCVCVCVCVWSAAVQSDCRAWPSAGAECPITRGGLSTSETRRQRLPAPPAPASPPSCILPSLARTCSHGASPARQASASSPIAAERGASLNPPPTCRSVAMTRCARPPWPSAPVQTVQTATWAPAHCWQAVVASLPWGLSPPEICNPSLPS